MESKYSLEEFVKAVTSLVTAGHSEEEIVSAAGKLLGGTGFKSGKFRVKKVRAIRSYTDISGGEIPKGTEHYFWQRNNVVMRSMTIPEGGYVL